MATLIPKKLPRLNRSLEFASFFRTLKKLDDDFTVWTSLHSDPAHPQFFVLFQETFAFLIQVAETSQQLAETAIQTTFLDNQPQLTPDTLGSAEADVLAAFLDNIHTTLAPHSPSGFPVRKLVVFPDVLHHTIDEIILHRSAQTDTSYLGLKQLPAAEFSHRLGSLAAEALPETALLHLRAAFDPGTVVPPAFSPLTVRDRNHSPTLTHRLLDIDQEWCVKNDLHLPPQQERLAADTGYRTQLVTGVAGCGKSLVLLYRALLSARLNPDSRVLVLTHNRPLRSELERRFHILSDDTLRIDWLTFYQWASRSLGDWPEEILYPSDAQKLLADLLSAHPNLASTTPIYLLDEISWIKDLNLRSREAYLTADRTGRGKGINREAVWDLFRNYQNTLNSHHLIDWPGVALRFHDAALAEHRLNFPHYDFIFVDEAQFFAKAWFDIVRAALKPGGHLFLAADPTQGFLRRRQSWIASGIDVRGRTTRLRQAYRNSRAILLFAASFYESRAALDPDAHREDDLNIPTPEQIAAITTPGKLPEIIHAASPHDLLTRACNEIAALHRSGLPNGHILILHTDAIYADDLHQLLAAGLGSTSLVHDAKINILPATAFCQHTTLNAATGLEAPIVFLLGIDSILETENDPRLSPDQRSELLRDHTRQLYMAFTRAAQRLVILCQHHRTEHFLSALLTP